MQFSGEKTWRKTYNCDLVKWSAGGFLKKDINLLKGLMGGEATWPWWLSVVTWGWEEGGVACWGYQMRGEGFMKGTTKNQKRYRPVKKKLLGPLFKWCRNVALLDTCLLQLAELSLSQMCDLSFNLLLWIILTGWIDTWVSAIKDRDQTNYWTTETVMELHLHDVRCFVGSFRRTISFLWIIFLPTKLHFHVGGGEAIVEEVWRMRNDWVSGVPSSHEDLHQTPSPAPPSSSSPRY